MLERHLNLKTGLMFCCGIAISLAVFFFVKSWEEENRFNEFKYKAKDHAAAIQAEFAHVAKNVADVRFLIEHDINIEHDNPLNPNDFMPMAEKLLIDDPDLLNIAWAIVGSAVSQAKAGSEKSLQVLYVKKGSHASQSIDDIRLENDYFTHDDVKSVFDSQQLLKVFLHRDEHENGNELNFIAQVGDRMQTGDSFVGKHLGSLIVEWDVEGLIERGIAKMPISAQDISIFILQKDGSRQAIYKHFSRSRKPDERQVNTGLHDNVTFDFANLHWQLEFAAAPQFLRKHPIVLAWQSLALGLLLSFFFVWYMRFEKRQTSIVEQQVIERTEQLAESKNNIHRIIDNLQDTYYQTDAEGVVRVISPSVQDLSGYTMDEVLGTRLADYYADPDGRAKFMQALSEADNGKIYDYEIESLHKDGHHTWVSSNSQLLYDESGQVIGVEGTLRDITEKKQREQEKEQMQQQIEHTQRLESLGILAGGITHNFKNILATIIGNASLAEHKLSNHPQDAKQHLAEIVSASEKATGLCQKVLVYAGKSRVVIESIQLSELIDNMADLLSVSVSRQAKLTYQLQDDLPHIDGDKAQIRQVIMNFITNASEAIDEKRGEITISTGVMHIDTGYFKACFSAENLVSGDYAYIKIVDAGCGMDAATLKKIFDPFFTTKFIGRGLGMSAVLGIVRAHGGAIKCNSAVGKGTVFSVFFPLSQSAQAGS